MNCGASTPLQTLGKQLSRDSAHQRDQFVDQGPQRNRFRSSQVQSANLEFNNFANGNASEFQALAPNSALHSRYRSQPQNQQNAPFSATQNQNWASQFSSLQIHDPTPHAGMINQATFGQTANLDQLFSRSFQTPLSHQRIYQPPSAHPNMGSSSTESQLDKRFAEVFSEVEADLNQSLKHEELTSTIDQDLSEPAKDLLNGLENTQTDQDTAQKFQSSQFVNLMQHLGSKNTVLQGDDLVKKESAEPLTSFRGPRVDPGPPNAQTMTEQEAYQEPQVGDPFEYLEKIGAGDQESFGPIHISPLHEANRLGPIKVKAADWIEDYGITE